MWLAQDPRRRVHDFIKKHTDIPVSVALPKGWTPRDGARIVVADDGTPRSNYAMTNSTIRVVVHAESLVRARQLMAAIDGLLMTPRYRIGLAISPGTGVFASPNSLVGGFSAFATYRVPMARKVEKDGTIA